MKMNTYYFRVYVGPSVFAEVSTPAMSSAQAQQIFEAQYGKKNVIGLVRVEEAPPEPYRTPWD